MRSLFLEASAGVLSSVLPDVSVAGKGSGFGRTTVGFIADSVSFVLPVLDTAVEVDPT